MSVAELEAEVAEYKLQLETVVVGLQADPENEELKNIRTELEEFISLAESSIAELKPAPASSAPSPPPPSALPPKEKWSKENHPAFQPGYRRPGATSQTEQDEKEDQPHTYRVNDTVMAKWKSGDKAFYPAKITSITGSSSKPVYIVTFKGYNNTETIFQHEIRPHHSQQVGQKRKAEDSAASGPSIVNNNAVDANSAINVAGPSYPSAPGVISAASTVDPALASAARNTADQSAGGRTLDGQKPAKVPKKISSNKALEGAKNKWQEFSAGGKGAKFGKKKTPKDSMFRTGEGVNAKVGFTGSGQAMRKDQARTRHIYERGGDDEI